MAAMDATGRKRLYLGLVVLAGACLILVMNWYSTSSEEPGSGKEQPTVQAEMRDVSFRHGKEGSLVWHLRTSRAQLGNDRDVVSMTDPEIEYAIQGNQTLVASSAKGTYNRANRTAAFWSGVSGTYGAVRFTAGRMEYAAGKERIQLLQGVHATRGNASIRSLRAEVQLDSQRVIFSRDAEVNLNAKSP